MQSCPRVLKGVARALGQLAWQRQLASGVIAKVNRHHGFVSLASEFQGQGLGGRGGEVLTPGKRHFEAEHG